MIKKEFKFWFLTGSQHLYGQETINQVNNHSKIIAKKLDDSLPFKVEVKEALTTSDSITSIIKEVNSQDDVVGIITWMHTFSPAKMWINGLALLNKPMLHLHTQFNRNIPFEKIDMDFMNLNQSAHGDREFGFINTRLNTKRKVVVGFYEDEEVINEIEIWQRAAVGYMSGFDLKVARFGDNMREVAVTEGDKVEAQLKFGWSVNGYGVGDLVEAINSIDSDDVQKSYDEMIKIYTVPNSLSTKEDSSIKEQIKIELGFRKFLKNGEFDAFTTTFEDLHGLNQLPGLAVQNLMGSGYGFGGEGDWKTSALVSIMKNMATGLNKGTTFMEDYTYHLEKGNEMVLGAHMLEVCPSVAETKPKIAVHPLGIGGKDDPARLIFEGKTGDAICCSLIDLGHKFRLIINEVTCINLPQDMPNLPVARLMWKPKPSLKDAAKAWIYAGGAHHTCLSFDLTTNHMIDYAEMAGIEYVVINDQTNMQTFRQELRILDSIK